MGVIRACREMEVVSRPLGHWTSLRLFQEGVNLFRPPSFLGVLLLLRRAVGLLPVFLFIVDGDPESKPSDIFLGSEGSPAPRLGTLGSRESIRG